MSVSGLEEAVMLPNTEVEALLFTVTDAIELAAAGAVDGGRRVLVSGLRRCDEARRKEAPWADDLCEQYGRVLERYSRRYQRPGSD
jgi:hypothetical protein